MPLARQVTNLANDRLKIVKVTLYLAHCCAIFLCVWDIAVQYFFVSGTLLCNISLCLAHCCEIFLVRQLNTLYLAQAGILT